MRCMLCASGKEAEFNVRSASISPALRMWTNPVFGYSQRSWSAWIAASRGLPCREPNWRCSQEALGQVKRRPGRGCIVTASSSVAGARFEREGEIVERLSAHLTAMLTPNVTPDMAMSKTWPLR